jgi:hypothetical protein
MPRPTLIATAGLVLAVSLPACVGSAGGSSGDRPTAATPAAAQECDAAGADFSIGQPWTEELGTAMLAATGARRYRAIPHNGAATMDYQSDRLTISLDAAGRVERVSCG